MTPSNTNNCAWLHPPPLHHFRCMRSTAGPLAVRKLTRKMHLGTEEAPAQHTFHTVCYAWVIVSRLQSTYDALHT